MFDGARLRRADTWVRPYQRGRIDLHATVNGSLGDALRIVSEAAVVRRPLSSILADPVTLLLSRRGVRRLYGFPHPERG